LTKEPKIYDGEKKASMTNLVRKLDICMQMTETRSLPVTLFKINSNRVLDLRLKTLKLLQERTGKTLKHIALGNNFLNRTPIA
jgi:hypothetical protein